MGLYYRYFSGDWSQWINPGDSYELEDDYRAAQLMYGNGAYVFWHASCPFEFVLTEVALIGTLQPYYFFQPVRSIQYLVPDGRWLSLAEVVENDLPYDVRYPVRTDFKNGYTQVVNRTDQSIDVETPPGTMTLPKNSFVAWSEATGLLAFSAFAPGTTHRVDYLKDPARQIEFVNPRGGASRGVTGPTLWHKGEIVKARKTTESLTGRE